MNKLIVVIVLLSSLLACGKDDNPVSDNKNTSKPSVNTPIVITANELTSSERQFISLMKRNLNTYEVVQVGMQKTVDKNTEHRSLVIDGEGNKTVDYACIFNVRERHTVLSIDGKKLKILKEFLSRALVTSENKIKCERDLLLLPIKNKIVIEEKVEKTELLNEISEALLGTEITVLSFQNILGSLYEAIILLAEDGFEKTRIIIKYDFSKAEFFNETSTEFIELPKERVVYSELVIDTQKNVDVASINIDGLEVVEYED